MATCLGKKHLKEEGGQGVPESLVTKGVMSPRAVLGKEAPDFEAEAFHNGEFVNIKLSDYRGKWVILCFYPADFTFV